MTNICTGVPVDADARGTRRVAKSLPRGMSRRLQSGNWLRTTGTSSTTAEASADTSSTRDGPAPRTALVTTAASPTRPITAMYLKNAMS